jgi:hypothetical protein
MKTVAAQYADREIHGVVDNLGTHFTPEVRNRLADNPNITFHRTLSGRRGLTRSIWFGLIARQAIRRGKFSSVKQFIATIKNYIVNCKPSTGLLMPTQSSPSPLDRVGSSQTYRTLVEPPNNGISNAE